MGALRLWCVQLAAALAAVSCLNGGPAVDSRLAPDIVFLHGKILTVDPDDAVAQAFAIKDGKIMAVGKNETIEALIGAQTQVIDLDGRAATPGLIDSHCHFSGVEMLYMLDLSYPAVKSIADVQAEVRSRVERLARGEWVRGSGWDEGKLNELRYITAADLDRVSPENPVWLEHTMGHYGTANTVALRLAKVTKDTPDPPGGTIDRYPDGTPTGVLKEAAQRLVTRLIPPFTPEQRQEGIAKIMEAFNREGMTAVKDPGFDEAKWHLYQNLLAEGKLTVRVFALWDVPETLEGARALLARIGAFTRPYVSTGDDLLISGGVKIYLDGSGGARTAWLYKDWNRNYTDVDRGNRGYPLIDPDIYRQQVLMFHKAGLHVSTHAIGDRAIDWAVDTYALVLKQHPRSGLRHGIIHCNIPTDHAIEVMRELQAKYDAGYPETQPPFMWWIGDTYAGNFGPERARRLEPLKTYLDKGILWAAGSDYPVTPFPARFGLWTSIARRPLRSTYGASPYGKDESIDVHAALRSYTIWGARQLFLQDKIGSIEVGKSADIAVWDKDPYSIPPEQLKDLECQMTLLEGKIVHRARSN